MVSVPDAPTLDLTGAMTIEAWVRASQTGAYRTVAVKEGPGSVVYGLYAATRNSASGGDVGPTGDVMIGGTEIVARGRAAHGSRPADGRDAILRMGTLSVYVDGNLIASRPAPGAITTSSGALRIGGNTVRGEFFRGLIDELRIYKRALTVAEIRADMTVPLGQ